MTLQVQACHRLGDMDGTHAGLNSGAAHQVIQVFGRDDLVFLDQLNLQRDC